MSRAFPTCTSCRVRLLPGCQRSSQASGPHCCHCCCCHCCLQTCPLVPGWCPATVLQAGGCPGTPTTCTAQHSTAQHSTAQRVTAWGSTHVNATHSTQHAPRHSNSVRVLHKPWPRINVQHRIATRLATGLALVVYMGVCDKQLVLWHISRRQLDATRDTTECSQQAHAHTLNDVLVHRLHDMQTVDRHINQGASVCLLPRPQPQQS